jgi:hypothetical protein
MCGGAGTHPSGSTRNTLATLEVWRGTECTHFHERAYTNSAVGSCSATAGGFAKPLRGGAGDVGRHAPYYGLLEKADESCWFFSRTSAASSFRTGCPCARARRTRTTNEGGTDGHSPLTRLNVAGQKVKG